MNSNKFTLITGASEGFGKALAVECAKRGMNLVLVALPGPEMCILAKFLRECFSVKVYTFETDLSKDGACMNLFHQISELNIEINMLINNAGIGGTLLFKETEVEFLETIVRLNVLATTLLTKLFLPQLQANKPSYVLNVSSLGCFFFLPRKSVYGATKSYVYYLSKTLRKELKPLGISVTTICPGAMYTCPSISMTTQTGGWFARNSALNPEWLAPKALDGLLKGRALMIPGKLNRIFKFVDYILPLFIKNMLIGWQMNHLNSPAKSNGGSIAAAGISKIKLKKKSGVQQLATSTLE